MLEGHMDEQIKHKRLAEHIVEDLEAKIMDGTLQPGQRIVEEALCKTFMVSSTPLREAFQILENRGFVNREPRRGIFVARITVQEVEDIYPHPGQPRRSGHVTGRSSSGSGVSKQTQEDE